MRRVPPEVVKLFHERVKTSVNLHDLAAQLKAKRGSRSLREVASEADVSFSTLSRVEKGKVPDLDTFVRLCAWLQVPAEVFYLGYNRAIGQSTEEVVSMHLRGDRALDPEVATSLIKMVNLAFASLADKPT
jgi:transcriptional regulator with XRE-family HTH domain